MKATFIQIDRFRLQLILKQQQTLIWILSQGSYLMLVNPEAMSIYKIPSMLQHQTALVTNGK